MKKILLTVVLPVVLIAGAILAIGSSCGSNPLPVITPCDITNSKFKNTFAWAKTNITGAKDTISWDLDTHEYTFTSASNATICKVGYQGTNALFVASIPYKIEIVNGTGTVLYTGNHVFQSSATDYQAITPVNITAGQSYKIRRTVTNNLGNLNNYTGRVLLFGSSNFPVNNIGLAITASNFYTSGGPMGAGNYGIPYIDIVFQ